MKKRKPKYKVNNGIGGPRVSMTQLDDKLAEWVNVARNSSPVVVVRYDTPWVCIVSYPTWVDIDNLKSYIPKREHSLSRLRNALDEVFTYESGLLHDLTQKCESGVNAMVVIRAWVLQIVYAATSSVQIWEIINYNMLWRWFIGYTYTSDPLPDGDKFIRDMRMVGVEPQVIKLVYGCLNGDLISNKDECGFSINFGLLHALHDRYSPLEKSDGDSTESDKENGGGQPMNS